MGMTCLAIASMTTLYIGLVIGNSRYKRDHQEQQISIVHTESAELSEELGVRECSDSRYQL